MLSRAAVMEIIFEPTTIEGVRKGPALERFSARVKPRFDWLATFEKHFMVELQQTAREWIF